MGGYGEMPVRLAEITDAMMQNITFMRDGDMHVALAGEDSP
jgi:hypothetical protein